MKKRTQFISSLFLSTALFAPAAHAQTTSTQEPASEQAAEAENIPEEEEVDISAPGGDFGEDIIVRGRFIPNPIRATSEVVSVLGTEEIARAADGDIAGSLQRVTGLSVVGGRFVFVRGLGERYSLALLNGLPLPSPEPLRRVVPLDLFPTSVIASTVVQKSYSVNYPGEFGGGVINLTTKSTPDEPFLKISAGISGDSETTGQLGYTYDGSPTDIIGYDSDGIRSIPTGLQNAINQLVPISTGDNFTSLDLQNFAASLTNAETALIQRNNDIPANFSAEITGGTTLDVGEAFVGIIATAGFENSWRTRGGFQQQTQGIVQINGQDGLLPDRNFQFLQTQNRIIVNGLLAYPQNSTNISCACPISTSMTRSRMHRLRPVPMRSVSVRKLCLTRAGRAGSNASCSPLSLSGSFSSTRSASTCGQAMQIPNAMRPMNGLTAMPLTIRWPMISSTI